VEDLAHEPDRKTIVEADVFLQAEVDGAVREAPGGRRPDRALEGVRALARREVEALREVEDVGRAAGSQRNAGGETQIPWNGEGGVGDDSVAFGARHLVGGVGGGARIVEAEEV